MFYAIFLVWSFLGGLWAIHALIGKLTGWDKKYEAEEKAKKAAQSKLNNPS